MIFAERVKQLCVLHLCDVTPNVIVCSCCMVDLYSYFFMGRTLCMLYIACNYYYFHQDLFRQVARLLPNLKIVIGRVLLVL